VHKLTALMVLASSMMSSAWAQTAHPQQPEVRVNYLNVCTPGEAEQKEIAAALALVPMRPSFDIDFEVSRGRSTMPDQSSDNPNMVVKAAPVSNWVRVRHEFPSKSAFLNAQYSFSVDEKGMTETLALRLRDAAKSNSVLQISFQDSVTTGTPDAVLSSDTPVGRVRVERSGKSSLVLARCEGTDQARYEPIFRTASEAMAAYRKAMAVRSTVSGDLARLQTGARGGARKSRAETKKR
jgi:hypothetical protein